MKVAICVSGSIRYPNKGLKSIIGVDISKWSRKTVTVDINGATHTVKIRDLNRNGKLIHKKVTLVPHE